METVINAEDALAITRVLLQVGQALKQSASNRYQQ